MNPPELREAVAKDLSPCAACGRLEHVTLLDGKPPSGTDPDTTDWTRLECIVCYGPGYMAPAEHIGLSVRPDLAPLYALVTGLGRNVEAEARARQAALTRAETAERLLAEARTEIEGLREALKPFLTLHCSFDGFSCDPAELMLGYTRLGEMNLATHCKIQKMIDGARAALQSHPSASGALANGDRK